MRFLERLGLQKAKDPQEEMKKWRRELRKEQRAMDREISKLEQMERKSRDECRKYGKEGRQDACKIVAREIVRTRAARNRMLMAKAQINSVNMQLQTQAAMVRGRMRYLFDMNATLVWECRCEGAGGAATAGSWLMAST